MLDAEICASQSAPGAAPTLAFDWSTPEFNVRKSAKDRGGFATGLAGARSPRLKERCVDSLSDKADVTAVVAAAVGTSFWLLWSSMVVEATGFIGTGLSAAGCEGSIGNEAVGTEEFDSAMSVCFDC